MREHDLQPRRRRRYVATTDSDHDHPIYPNRTQDLTIDGPNQLWVADISVPQQSGVRDGGRSPAISLQERVANHLSLGAGQKPGS